MFYEMKADRYVYSNGMKVLMFLFQLDLFYNQVYRPVKMKFLIPNGNKTIHRIRLKSIR